MSSARQEMSSRPWIPWDRPAEIAIWAIALIVATFFIHNVMQAGKRALA